MSGRQRAFVVKWKPMTKRTRKIEVDKDGNEIPPISPFVIFPFPKKLSFPVQSWEEIREEAELMIQRIQKDEYRNRMWKQAYAMAHTQVVAAGCNSADPFCPKNCAHHKNFFVVNRKQDDVRKLFGKDVIINPKILGGSMQQVEHPEGCMSDPYSSLVKKKRFTSVTVEYFVRGWFGRLRKKTEKVEGLKAMIFQHEIDHLNGVC